MLPFCEGARVRGKNAARRPPAGPFSGGDVARGFAQAHEKQFGVLPQRGFLVPSRNPLALVTNRFPRAVAGLLSGFAGHERKPPAALVSVLSSVNLAETMSECQRIREPRARFRFLVKRLSRARGRVRRAHLKLPCLQVVRVPNNHQFVGTRRLSGFRQGGRLNAEPTLGTAHAIRRRPVRVLSALCASAPRIIGVRPDM